METTALRRRSVLALPLALSPWLARGEPPTAGYVWSVPARAGTVGIQLAPSGRLVVSGTVVRDGRSGAALLALAPDGVPDPAFGSGGEVFVAADRRRGITSLAPHALALQPDGRIVLAGECATDEHYSSDFLVMRFLPDGRLDTSFGERGWTNTPIGRSHDMARAVAIDAAGRIVAAGGSLQSQLVIAARYDFALARYRADGQLDAAFGRGGKSVIRVGSVSEDFGYAAAVDARGGILVTGRAHTRHAPDLAVLRVRADGRLDAGFGAGGAVMTRFGDAGATGHALAVQPDGKVVVGGALTGAESGAIVARHLADGRADGVFGVHGVVRLPLIRGVAALGVQRDGRLVVLGVSPPVQGRWPSLRVLRLMPSGHVDESFGRAGVAALTTATSLSPSGLAVSPAGEIHACASLMDRFERPGPGRVPGVLLVKFTPQGELDARFGAAAR